MPNRVKDFANTASTPAADDFLGLDGATNGSRKIAPGTSITKNIPAAGNAASGEVVLGNDTRLTDSRTPTAHTHAIADVTSLQTSLDAKEPAQTAATQAEAEAGTQTAIRSFSPLRIKQAITALGGGGFEKWDITFDGQGAVVTSGVKVFRPVCATGTIKASAIVGDASGAITISVKRYTPSAGSLGSATTLGDITLSSAQHARDTTLTGWTKSVTAGDVLEFLTGGTITTVKRVSVNLTT